MSARARDSVRDSVSRRPLPGAPRTSISGRLGGKPGRPSGDGPHVPSPCSRSPVQMAVGPMKYLRKMRQAPAGRSRRMPENLNLTNRLRPSDGDAFTLPSDAARKNPVQLPTLRYDEMLASATLSQPAFLGLREARARGWVAGGVRAARRERARSRSPRWRRRRFIPWRLWPAKDHAERKL